MIDIMFIQLYASQMDCKQITRHNLHSDVSLKNESQVTESSPFSNTRFELGCAACAPNSNTFVIGTISQLDCVLCQTDQL